jgi:hypothetical protein
MDKKKYYFKGVPVYEKNIIDKIEKNAKLCRWHDSEDMIDRTFTGYKLNDQYYDICSYLYKKDMEEVHRKEREYVENFTNTKNLIIKTIEDICKFLNSIEEIYDIKGKIRNLEKKLLNGFVINQERISGGKKKRRYKKDNKRYLIDSELEKISQDKKHLENLEIDLSKKIKFEDFLEKILKQMNNIDENLMIRYNNRFEWHETVALYREYENYFTKLNKKINHFTFSNIQERYMLLKKELDIELSDVKLFEETLEKVRERLEEERQIEEMMTVKERRHVSKKAKFYIDENGKRIELDENIDQVVIHR